MAAMAEDYVTKKDLAEFTELIIGRMGDFERNVVAHMDKNFVTKQEFKQEFTATEDRLTEKIHDVETRILRGYESHARAVEAHLKTLDGQSAANFLAQVGLGERMSALEARMLNLEVGKRPPQ